VKMQTRASKPAKPLIMVVDDEESLRLVLRAVLRAHGFRVLVASRGDDALRICKRIRRPIALMVTDLQLPGLSGFELAEEAARLRPRMPVLFISGGFRDHDCKIRERLGPGREFLAKPFNLNSFASKLDSMMSVPQSP